MSADDSIRSQRWRDRRMRFVGNARTIDPAIHSVDVISCQRTAKPFVENHHYSRSLPPTRMSCGLFRNEGGKGALVGVVSFSVSMSANAGLKHTGLEGRSSAELGRLVLLDHVEGNAESWFVARAFSLLRQEKPEIEAVYSYSDPVPRIDSNGHITMPGHVGEIYQALNAACRGRATARTHILTPDGQIFSERALSKIRLEERGIDYAIREMLDRGASPMRSGESGRDWLDRLRAEGFLTTKRHPGNWVYSFPLTRKAKSRSRLLPTVPYPKRSGISANDVTSNQAELDFAA